MITKLLGVATLFTAGSILVGSAPTLGAQDLSGAVNGVAQTARCGHRCARIPRCAHIPRCGHRCSHGGGGGGGHRCGHLLDGAPPAAVDQA
jgi:hypothetical protein